MNSIELKKKSLLSIPQDPVPEGLLHFYRFNNSGVDEINGNNLTASGSAVFDGESFNDYYCYDGIGTGNNYALSNSSVNLPITQSWACWVYCRDYSNSPFLFGNLNFRASNIALRIVSNGTLAVQVEYPGSAEAKNISTISLDTWTHVAFTLDSSFNLTCYINGLKIIAYTITNTFVTSPMNLLIGKQITSLTSGFNGKLENLRIYNRTISDDEVTSIFNYESTVNLQSGLTNHYLFNSNGNNEKGGSTLVIQNANSNFEGVSFNGSKCYDTHNSYAVSANKTDFSGSQTWAGWVNLRSTPGSIQGIFGCQDYVSTKRIGVQFTLSSATATPNNIALFVYGGAESAPTTAIAPTYTVVGLRLNLWHHYAFTYDQDALSVKFFVNGILVATRAITEKFYFEPTNVCIGRWASGLASYHADALIENVRRYDRILQPIEVAQIYIKERVMNFYSTR